MPQLLDSLERHESGKVIIASGHADLKHSPPPRFDLIDLDSYLDMALVPGVARFTANFATSP